MPLYEEADYESLVVLRPEERIWGFIVHAVAWIPVWGFVINAMVWLYYKNRSREMVFHVQQAIQFQIFVLIPLIVWAVASVFFSILAALSPFLAWLLQSINSFLLSVFLTAAAALGLWGAISVYLGKPFLYPFFGRQVLEGSIRKISEN